MNFLQVNLRWYSYTAQGRQMAPLPITLSELRKTLKIFYCLIIPSKSSCPAQDINNAVTSLQSICVCVCVCVCVCMRTCMHDAWYRSVSYMFEFRVACVCVCVCVCVCFHITLYANCFGEKHSSNNTKWYRQSINILHICKKRESAQQWQEQEQ